MANLLIASGLNNFIITSPDGDTWTPRNADDSSGDILIDQAWDGNQTYILVGGTQIFTSTNGGVAFASQVLPTNTNFGIVTILGQSGILKPAIWDGTQFVVVGWVTGSPDPHGVVGTSPDGLAWTWANLADSIQPIAVAYNGTTYVVLDWRAFKTGGAQKSRFYASTVALGAYTVKFTSSTEDEYAWLGTNGPAFIAFSSQNSVTAWSPDGDAWTENAGMAIFHERFQVLWDVPTSQWIVNGILANGHVGIATTPTGAIFTTRLDTGVDQFTGYSRSVLRGSNGNLFAWVGPTATGQPYTSVDNGNTWSSLGPSIATTVLSDIISIGTQFVALYSSPIGVPDNGISTSPDLVTLTSRYDDAAFDIFILRLYGPPSPPPPPPPPTAVCIPIEWQSLSILVNEGQYAMVQRVFIDIDCNGQVITPTLLVDENLTPSEYVMPNITNTERGAIEIPFQRKAKILAVRLNACVTARVEWFGWAIDIRPTQP